MAHLTWAAEARRQHDDIAAYLGRSSPAAARDFVIGVDDIAADIPGRPYFGAEVTEYGLPDIRERQFKSYRLIYRIHPGGDCVMVGVYHAARRLPRTPPG